MISDRFDQGCYLYAKATDRINALLDQMLEYSLFGDEQSSEETEE
jgi:hypothetical protein